MYVCMHRMHVCLYMSSHEYVCMHAVYVCVCIRTRNACMQATQGIMHVVHACTLACSINKTCRMPASWDGMVMHVIYAEKRQTGILTVSKTNGA